MQATPDFQVVPAAAPGRLAAYLATTPGQLTAALASCILGALLMGASAFGLGLFNFSI